MVFPLWSFSTQIYSSFVVTVAAAYRCVLSPKTFCIRCAHSSIYVYFCCAHIAHLFIPESWWNCLAFSNLFIIQYVSQRVTQQTDRNSTNTFGFKKVREHQLIHTHSKPLLSLHLYEENPISLCILTLFSKLDCKKRILHKQSDSSFFCKITTANGPIFMKGPNVLHDFFFTLGGGGWKTIYWM